VVVGDLLLLFAGDASHYGALARVTLVVLDVDALTQEVKLYSVSSLTVVQSNLDAARTRADTLQIVFVHSSFKHVLAS